MSVERVAKDHLTTDNELVASFKRAFNPLMGGPPPGAADVVKLLTMRLELSLNVIQALAAEIVAGRIKEEPPTQTDANILEIP